MQFKEVLYCNLVHITHQTFFLMKTPWRCLSPSSSNVLTKTNIFILVILLHKSLQDVLVKTNIFVLPIDIFQISSRRLQNVFKSSCKSVFKTSSRCLQDVLERYLQDVSDKTYHQVKLFLLTSLRDVFNTFLRRTAKTFIYRRICLGHYSEKILVSVQNLQES